ncbi:MAG: hypothetical protein SGARI_007445, partial [Bacillariaceae sp.]
VPAFLPAERTTSQADIALGDGSLSPQMTASDSDDEEAVSDEELGEANVAVDEAPSTAAGSTGEENSDQFTDSKRATENEETDQDGDVDQDIQVCGECSSDSDTDEQQDIPKIPKKKIIESKQSSMAVSETPSQKLEADYFGIESDVRGR